MTFDREAWMRTVEKARTQREVTPREEEPLYILLHYFPTLLWLQHKRYHIYGHPAYTAAVHCSTRHCSRITACIAIRTGGVTLRGLRKDAVRPTLCCVRDRMFDLQWTGKYAQRTGRGRTKVPSRNLPGRTEAEHRSTASTTGIRTRFEAGTTLIQVYSVTATLTF